MLGLLPNFTFLHDGLIYANQIGYLSKFQNILRSCKLLQNGYLAYFDEFAKVYFVYF
ncbi:hypothetical protein [Campylobacter geochelonis]|uniref:hypothetical protein n=1 Tax=Campylobacter geochelonis TaxID=1780362 RepID=UPI000AAD9F78|nr:hypothetical protein [Campylobacter geochelonis]